MGTDILEEDAASVFRA